VNSAASHCSCESSKAGLPGPVSTIYAAETLKLNNRQSAAVEKIVACFIVGTPLRAHSFIQSIATTVREVYAMIADGLPVP